jgi:hypothetical protein
VLAGAIMFSKRPVSFHSSEDQAATPASGTPVAAD